MTDPRQHIAEYLATHQGAHIREVTTAMRDRGLMCWNTAYKTIVKMADEGTITLTEGRRAVSFDGGIIAPNKPRNRIVKLCWLTIADDDAKPLAERPDTIEVEFDEMERKTQTEKGHEEPEDEQTGPTIRRLPRSG